MMMLTGLLTLLFLHACAATSQGSNGHARGPPSGPLPYKSAGPTAEDHKRLDKYLREDPQTREVLPRLTDNYPVNVTVGLSLLNFKVDLNDDKLYVNAWIREKWTDYRLMWIPSDYAGITETRMVYWRFWRPDLSLYNSYGPQAMNPVPNESLMVAYNTGSILFYRHVGLESLCRFDPDEDAEQICTLRFGSWTFDGSAIDLYTESNTIELSDYSLDRRWTISNTKAERRLSYYACCKEPYVSLYFTITFQKRQPKAKIDTKGIAAKSSED